MAEPKIVRVPSTRQLGDAGIDFAAGAVGGVAYRGLTRITGSGFIAGAASAVVAGALLRGNRGEIVATMLGFAAAQDQAIGNFVDNLPLPRIGS